ncbi:MAG: RluA family pseudouridine synthase [Planctomycetales bacterium]|nr:RluA family pseudouridine synthase [Planctomycetales bacterium]
MSTSTPLQILYEDNHLLVVNKPAGIATMGTAAGTKTMFTLAKEYLKRKYQKPGNVYLGVVSRLDSLVSGVLVFARTSKAAARLSEQFREHKAKKTYWAIVEGAPHPQQGELIHWMAKDEAQQRMVVRPKRSADALEARLRYQTLREFSGETLLEVELLTGRKHQIRVQLAQSGHPILGDRKYGSGVPFAAGIALHARALTIEHPTLKKPMTFTAEISKAFEKWLSRQ